ncbi:hypothetical protein [Neomoorella thermoacetica]|nr:hypothetical protein [Moorella thermoacetica]
MKYLSQDAEKVWREVLTDPEYGISAEDYKIKVNDAGTFIPKDFCIVSLLNEFQRYLDKGLSSEKKFKLPIRDDIYDWLSEFGLFLEYVLAVHDGRREQG